jgi:septal ring factor EnvC (AmiA/AmiB activator)
MGIFSEIEKLITEHGSAAILKERIALAEDQYAALERKLSDAEARLQKTEAERERLGLENGKLAEKVQNLEEQLLARRGQRLEEEREKLLIALSSRPEALAPHLAQSLGISEQRVTFHLEELAKARLISAARFYTSRPTIWRIAQDGRAYLASHGLLT